MKHRGTGVYLPGGKSILNYSYRSFSCKQISHNLMISIMLIGVVDFFEPHNFYNQLKKAYQKNLEIEVQQNFANKSKFLEVIA